MIVDELISKIYAAPRGDREDRSSIVSEIIELTMDAMRSGDLSQVEELLEKLDPEKCHTIYPVTVLRSSFRVHRQLRNWELLRDRCVVAFERAGIDVAGVLTGLIDTSWYRKNQTITNFFIDDLMGVHPSLRK